MTVHLPFARIVLLLALIVIVLTPLPGTKAQAPTASVESDDPLVTQSGNWTATEDVNASGSRYLFSGGSPNDTLTLDFSGSYLEIVYVAAPWAGTLVIEIDGVERRTVNTNGDWQFNQSVVFQYLTAEAHTLTVSAVEGDLIAVDAFVTVPLVPGITLLAAHSTSTSTTDPPHSPATTMGPETVSMLSETKIMASDGETGDYFGADTAIDGDRIIVGATGDDDNGTDSGAAYIYERQVDGTWSETKLTPSDGSQGANFGRDVDISGARAIVASCRTQGTGAAYIFERQPDGAWVEATKLTPSDGSQGTRFGWSVALDGERAIVGDYLEDAPGPVERAGVAYIYDRQEGGTWQETKLSAADASLHDYFGFSVDIDGERAIVGATNTDTDGITDSGSVYVFDRQSNGSWTQIELTASDAAPIDQFGSSVSVDGDYIVVGAEHADQFGPNTGAAYVFARQPNGSWSETKLLSSDANSGHFFGGSVDISNTLVIAGAKESAEVRSSSGAAYIFERQPGGTWVETKLTASDRGPNEYFGKSVGISGNRAVIGTIHSAYIYDVVTSPTTADTNLLTNGDFSSGREPWLLYGDFNFELVDGVMRFYRHFPGWKGAQLFQDVNVGFPQNAPLQVQVDVGNSSNVPKGVEIRLRNRAWTDVLSCSVTIPPNTPLTTVTMQGLTNEAWDDFNFTLSLYDNDNIGAVLVDNASVEFRPSDRIYEFGCDGFTPKVSQSLLNNGDFSNGRFYWTLWGDFAFGVNSGVMEYYRLNGATRLANLFNDAPTWLPENASLRLQIQIGNSSAVTKTVDVMVRDAMWSQVFMCSFQVGPYTPLTTVYVQGKTNQPWTNPMVMLRAWDADSLPAVLVDNAVLTYLGSGDVSPTCVIP